MINDESPIKDQELDELSIKTDENKKRSNSEEDGIDGGDGSS
jgi:hypothetical protein